MHSNHQGQSVFKRSGHRFASRKRVKSKNLEPRFDSIETEKALGSRAFRLLELPSGYAAPVEVFDLNLGVGQCSIVVGPGEADFQCREQVAVDDDRLLVRPADPGVPQTLSGLESLDRKAVMIALHVVTPCVAGCDGNMNWP